MVVEDPEGGTRVPIDYITNFIFCHGICLRFPAEREGEVDLLLPVQMLVHLNGEGEVQGKFRRRRRVHQDGGDLPGPLIALQGQPEGLSSGGAERESGGAEEGGGISGGQDMEP